MVCTQPPGGGYLLCQNCGDQIADDLTAIADYLPAELDITASRQDRITISPGRGGETGLPWKDTATTALADLAGCVLLWARTVNRGSDWLIPGTLTEVARWLWCRVDWIRSHDGAADAHRQITGTVSRAVRVIDLPATRSRFPVGPCPEVVEGGACTGTVWAYIATRARRADEPRMASSPEDESRLRCWECGARWVTPQWLTALKGILTRQRQLGWRRAA